MKKFIAYFDFLGFKDFMMNNSFDEQRQGMQHIYRDIELALSKRKTVDSQHGRIADLSAIKINCINFSDTVVFWTNDNSLESFNELLETSYNFNWHQNLFTFPARGAIVYGDINHSDFREVSSFAGKYNVNSLYGRGLVDAYLKAESQQWAGTVIDGTVIEFLQGEKAEVEKLLEPFAVKFKIPYKNDSTIAPEYVLRLVKGSLNEFSFRNVSDGIRRNFSEYNKGIDHHSVQEKLNNTLEFLASFKSVQ